MHSDKFQKHDAHVTLYEIKLFSKYFPFKAFLLIILIIFSLGFLLGNSYGVITCQSFMSLFNK